MRRVTILLGFVLVLAIAFASCKAHKPCDAYGKAGDIHTSKEVRS